jgi:hypothetical protein
MIISNDQYSNAQEALALLVSKDNLNDKEKAEKESIEADIEEFESMIDDD